jgi:GAF domain-containing protein
MLSIRTTPSPGRLPTDEPEAALRELALAVHETLDLEQACAAGLSGLRRLIPGLRSAAVYLQQPDGELLELQQQVGEWQDEARVDPDSDHPAARALQDARAVWIESGDRGPSRGYAPVGRKKSGAGVLAVEMDRAPGEGDRGILARAARAAAAGIANAQAYRRASESRAQLAEIARRKASLQIETELCAQGERLLNDLHGAIHESADAERIVQLATPMLRLALRASRCIALLAAEGEFRDFVDCEPEFPLDSREILWEASDLVQMVERTGRPAVIDDPRQLREYSGRRLELWQQPATLLAVPAFRQERLSAIFVYHHCGGPRTWTKSEVDLAQRAADQVATALHNARLYQTAIAAEQFQRTLVEIQSALTTNVGLAEILEGVARHGATLLNADAGYVWRVDRANEELVGVAAVGHRADRFEGVRTPLRRGRGLAVAAFNEGVAQVSLDAANDSRVNQRIRRLLDCSAAVALPIPCREGTIGVVVFGYRRPVASMDEADVQRAQMVVAEAAQAIQSAHLYKQAQRRAEDWQILWNIGQTITADLDEDHVIASLVEGTARILRVNACSLLLLDRQTGGFSQRYQMGLSRRHADALKFARGARIPACLAADGSPQITHDLRLQGDYVPEAVEDGLRTMLSVPLIEPGEKTVGALSVYAGPDRRFSIADLEALSTLASFGLAAMNNARRYNRERRIARALQEPFVAGQDLAPDGLQIALRTLPALREADIGGDYFDTIPLESGELVVAIGDVAGKGLNAAVHSQSLRWMMRTLVHESCKPAKLLTRLNRLLFQYTAPEGFVTLFYGLFDPHRLRLRYANAGHLPPLLARRGSRSATTLDCSGLMLGVEPTAEFEEDTVQLEPGDVLALFTDGITDAGARGKHLEVEGLAACFDASLREDPGGDLSAHAIAEQLFAAVRAHAGGVLKDDATLLVIRAAGGGRAGLVEEGRLVGVGR